MVNMEKVRRLLEIDSAIASYNSRMDELKEERKELEEDLLEQFSTEGVSSLSVDGRIVYIHRQIWASAVEESYDKLVRTLRSLGLGEMVKPKINTQVLSAYVREQLTVEGGLNKKLAPLLKVSEVFSIRNRKK